MAAGVIGSLPTAVQQRLLRLSANILILVFDTCFVKARPRSYKTKVVTGTGKIGLQANGLPVGRTSSLLDNVQHNLIAAMKIEKNLAPNDYEAYRGT